MCEFSIHKRCQIDSLGDCGDWNFIYPQSRCSADCNSANIFCIILLLHPTSALLRQSPGPRCSFILHAHSNPGCQNDVRGGFECVIWVLVSLNLKRCERSLLTSTSKHPLEQKQCLAPYSLVVSASCSLAVCSRWLSSQKVLAVMVLWFTDLAFLLQRFDTILW